MGAWGWKRDGYRDWCQAWEPPDAGLWSCCLPARGSQDLPPHWHPPAWLRHSEAAAVPAAGLARTATAGSPVGAKRRGPAPGRDCASRARSQGAEFPGSSHLWLPGAQAPPLPAESAPSLCESSALAWSQRAQNFTVHCRFRGAGAEARRGTRGGRRGGEGKAVGTRGAGGDSSGGFEGRCSPASTPSSPPLQNRRSGGAWTKPCCSGTMTLARFVVALVLGALPEVVGFDLVLRYPLHHRYRHSLPPGPPHPYYLPTQQRQQRTPLSPSLPRVPRVPRPPPALHAQRLHALHAGRTPGPHPGDCPAGEPWVNVTDFGAPCLLWAEVPPFLERSPPASWAQLRGQRHNFCRSPDGAGRPWCFYGNAHGKVDWGYCDCRHGE